MLTLPSLVGIETAYLGLVATAVHTCPAYGHVFLSPDLISKADVFLPGFLLNGNCMRQLCPGQYQQKVLGKYWEAGKQTVNSGTPETMFPAVICRILEIAVDIGECLTCSQKVWLWVPALRLRNWVTPRTSLASLGFHFLILESEGYNIKEIINEKEPVNYYRAIKYQLLLYLEKKVL